MWALERRIHRSSIQLVIGQYGTNICRVYASSIPMKMVLSVIENTENPRFFRWYTCAKREKCGIVVVIA